MPTNAINDTGVKYVYDKLDAKKVEKEAGKGLSTNDYTTAEKNKVATIDSKADKVTSAINGNLAGLNSSGNPTDSGISGDMTTTSATGNPISIAGLKSAQIALNPVITFEPIQAGSGTPSPSNIRAISGYDKIEVLSCQKNLYVDSPYFDDYTQSPANSWTKQTDKYNQHDVWKSTNAAWNRLYKMRYLPVGTYVFSCMVKADDTGLAQIYATIQGTTTATVTTTETAQNLTTTWKRWTYKFNVTVAGLVALRIEKQTAGVLYVSEYQIEQANSFTDYTPYHKTTDLSESLGQTVYGGSLDVRTGVLTVTHGIVDLGTLSWAYYNNYYAELSNMKKLPALQTSLDKCSMYNVEYNGNSQTHNDKNYVIYAENNTLNIFIRDTTVSSASDLVAKVTGQKLVYELATPFTIQLTPHEISLLKDYAYVSTNGTNIALDYHNGELASLSDVSQLGETVNELGANLLNVVEDVTSKFVMDSTNVYQSMMQVLKIGKMVFINGSIRPQALTSLQNKKLFGITDSRLLPLVGAGINITANFVPVETAQSTTLPLIVVINSAYNQLRTSNNGAYGGISNITTSSLIIFSGAYVCKG